MSFHGLRVVTTGTAQESHRRATEGIAEAVQSSSDANRRGDDQLYLARLNRRTALASLFRHFLPNIDPVIQPVRQDVSIRQRKPFHFPWVEAFNITLPVPGVIPLSMK